MIAAVLVPQNIHHTPKIIFTIWDSQMEHTFYGSLDHHISLFLNNNGGYKCD